MARGAVTVCWRSTFEAAVAEAVRLGQAYASKFGAPDHPYRVRKRRSPGSRHDLWRVYIPWGSIPDRRS